MNIKCNVFGDSFLKTLMTSLKRSYGVEVRDEVTVDRGSINKLRHKLKRFYENREAVNPEVEEWCVIMIGTYNIIRCGNESPWKISQKLKRQLSVLIALLERHNRYIILLTALPLSIMDGKKHYWQLLSMYNKHIKKLSKNPKIVVLDLFPFFTEKRMPYTCNRHCYDKGKLGAELGLSQVWNIEGMEKGLKKILDTVVNLRNLESHSTMATTVEHADIKNENSERTSVDGISETNLSKSGTMCKNDDDDDFEYDYETDLKRRKLRIGYREVRPRIPYYEWTVGCYLDEIQDKLSDIRNQEYSNYGRQLLKENKMKSIENELVTVATYNVLSQDLLEKHKQIYANHDRRLLNWDLRREILREEFRSLNADILCLQEVDFSQLDWMYTEELYEKGYKGVYKKKTHGKTDGCVIYYKTNKFDLVESLKVELYRESVKLLDRDNIGIILKLSLKNRPEIKIVVATTHLLYNPKRADLKLVQTQLMLAEIERFSFVQVDPKTGETDYLPIIFTGDMNYYPGSAGYELVTKSHFKYAGKPNKYLLPYTEGRLLDNTLLPAGVGITDSCQYLSSISTRDGSKSVSFESGSLAHPLTLSSVYSHIKDDYPEATTNQDQWITADYIFYSQSIDPEQNCRVDGSLKLVSKLTLPNSKEAEKELINIPNIMCGSDHLPLLATFHVTGTK